MPNHDIDGAVTSVHSHSLPHPPGSSNYHNCELQGNLNIAPRVRLCAADSTTSTQDILAQAKIGIGNDSANHLENRIRSGRLNIGIVGAGIAGLAAAIALRREGHDIELFERSKFTSDIGAAIVIGPNASRILSRWGFDFKKSQAVVAQRIRMFKADTLETVMDVDCRNCVEEFGAEMYLLHRVDLHGELLRLAMEAEEKGVEEGGRKWGKVGIRLNAEVVVEGADVEKGEVMLKSGEVVRKDLIIAADGVHSLFVNKITNALNPASHSGFSAFRFLIPTTDLLSETLTNKLFSGPSQAGIAIHPDNRRLVFYPCRGSTIQNFAGIHPVADSSSSPAPHAHACSGENWHLPSRTTPTPQDVNHLISSFPNIHPSLKAIFPKAKDIKLWPLLHRSALKTWHRGRCLVIGDAAHAMLPHQGQAGAMALEDAAALGVMFSRSVAGLVGGMKRESIEGGGDDEGESEVDKEQEREIMKRLELFEKARMHRATGMQVFSSVAQDEADEKIPQEALWKYLYSSRSSTNDHGSVEEEAIAKESGKGKEHGEGGKRKLRFNAKEFEVWKFGHDVVEQSRKVLREEGYVVLG